jgi:hypothetical protein
MKNKAAKQYWRKDKTSVEMKGGSLGKSLGANLHRFFLGVVTK